MISILISTYNQDPSDLVRGLSAQLRELGQPYEIVIGNDNPDSNFMPLFDNLSKMEGVKCYHPSQNLGRSKIRNAMADLARYPILIFIDGDAEINSSDFIRNYVSSASEGMVVCGGTAYHRESPKNKAERLRWKYGMNREAVSAIKRNNKPYHSFSSFNFLIKADVFKRIGFNENISRYGHEDTVFGIELERNQISVKHIDNGLIHDGLEPSEKFLEKTVESILNLIDLEKSYDDPNSLYMHIRLLKRYKAIRKLRLGFIIKLINLLAGTIIRRNLVGPFPSLILFDLYKLCLLHENQA